ncbi:hypothetical protein B0T11DRAFT_301179 [Plectosphaerella cucumerina]|uniref:Uncharacterized protein n=1 Tax=Plectosphaerella cucumerina TaxID=40658 RepID=A0A8K0T8Q4_9PEZI|nr:hypothetical protein B0T11DRAFT_301179 [Plectosphaerella cucumerina]
MSTGQGPGPLQGTGTRVKRDSAPSPVQQGVTSPEPPLPPTAREKLKRLVADHLIRGTHHVKFQRVQELATSNPSLRDTFLAPYLHTKAFLTGEIDRLEKQLDRRSSLTGEIDRLEKQLDRRSSLTGEIDRLEKQLDRRTRSWTLSSRWPHLNTFIKYFWAVDSYLFGKLGFIHRLGLGLPADLAVGPFRDHGANPGLLLRGLVSEVHRSGFARHDTRENSRFWFTRGDLDSPETLDSAGSAGALVKTPASFADPDVPAYTRRIATNIRNAVVKSGSVKRLVYISSLGAQHSTGVGEVRSNHESEVILRDAADEDRSSRPLVRDFVEMTESFLPVDSWRRRCRRWRAILVFYAWDTYDSATVGSE